jgi:tetratricopeptide (TPR) repeat protein
MKKFIFILLISVAQGGNAQDANRLHEMGKNYMIDGDYSNAESLLNNAYNLDTSNIIFTKDLALCLYFEKDYKRGIKLLIKKIDEGIADDQTFQIAGTIYRANQQLTEAENLYLQAIKKFPSNGAFYNEIGELFSSRKDNRCIDFWERGIELDPIYTHNYFNACKYYENLEPIWSIIYGETYVILDPLNQKTSEIKDILLSNYKNYFADLSNERYLKEKNKFMQRVLLSLSKQFDIVVEKGLTTSTLTMIRTKFILDWYNDKTEKYPFKLFDFHLKLLREGLFESYNQWLFGSSENLISFQNWTQLHNQEYNEFMLYFKANPFKPVKNEFYH